MAPARARLDALLRIRERALRCLQLPLQVISNVIHSFCIRLFQIRCFATV
jgi:hypothetical protein